MTLEEALDFYKSGYRICMVLNISRQNFTAWKHKGYIPYAQQAALETHSNGYLKANIEDLINRYNNQSQIIKIRKRNKNNDKSTELGIQTTS